MTGAGEPVAYPAIHHIGIVVGQAFAAEHELLEALACCDVVAPLQGGNASRTGKYRTLRVSVRVVSRDELEVLDRRLRAVTGVRMLL